MQRIGGFRRKTRHKLRKKKSDRGKIAITRYLQKFEMGERVVLKADSSVQKGMYFPRFHGLSGVIQGMQGKNYKVKIKDGGKDKSLLVHPVHLKK
jgi:large subunit ribosomal protein L21e